MQATIISQGTNTVVNVLQLAAVPFFFFCVHACLSYRYYDTCRSNIFVVFLYDNARVCYMMENVMQLIEKAMWCYAIAIVKDLKCILSWVYRKNGVDADAVFNVKSGDGTEGAPASAVGAGAA
jgi:hypothetical protein